MTTSMTVDDVLVRTAPVRSWAHAPLPLLTSVDEVTLMRTSKRRDEHLTSRSLLSEALRQWGMTTSDLMSLEIRRDPHRAPYLAWIQGTFRRTDLPSISIGHGAGQAIVAVCGGDRWIGIDSEPKDRAIDRAAYDLFARGDELDILSDAPERAMLHWVAKEAVQKAMRLGMHLDPRSIPFGADLGVGRRSVKVQDVELTLIITEDQGWWRAVAIRDRGDAPSDPESSVLEDLRRRIESATSMGEVRIGCRPS